ncbi:MAG: type II secretion system protein M, partial [Gammaproteobacteria bacterium]|nr:type II secretion system protein M [Gammaproteobacteria bacterium]
MEKLKQLIAQLQEKIDALSLRERAILFLAISFALFTAVDYLLLSPLELKQKNLLDQIQSIQAENSQLEGQALSIINRYRSDPNQSERQQLAQLDLEIEESSDQIEEAVAGLIPPEKMALALENLLQRQKSLKFISIDSLPAEPLLQQVAIEGEETAAIVEGAPTQSIYRHSFRLRFEGSYLDTLAYLKELESLQWSFRWDELDMTTIEYPTVGISLVIHTISLDEGL